jgi:hypothetical protein
MRVQEVGRSAVHRGQDGEVMAMCGVGGGERRSAPLLGVKALMLAMLEDAVRAYLGNEPRDSADAEEWIGSRRRWLFAFPTVCETLGLEPEAARAALRRMRGDERARHTFSFARSRPNARQANLRVVAPRIRRRRVDVSAPRVPDAAPSIPPAVR